METLFITEDNIRDFDDIVPRDIAENISREMFGGAVITGDDDISKAALMWETNNVDNGLKPTICRMYWMNASSDGDVKTLMSKYGEAAKDISADKSIVDLHKSDAGEFKGVFKEERFDIKERECSELVVSIDELSKLDIVRKSKLPSNLFSLGRLLSRAYRSGLMNCLFNTRREALEDLSLLPMDWFEPDVSCYVKTDDKITGFLLVHKLPSGRLRVEFMSAIGPDARIDLVYMVRFAIRNAMSKYPGDTEVILPRRDAAAQKLAAYFFPDRKGVSCIYGERKESLKKPKSGK